MSIESERREYLNECNDARAELSSAGIPIGNSERQYSLAERTKFLRERNTQLERQLTEARARGLQQRERIAIGEYTIEKPGPTAGTVWIQNTAGEGMETSEAKLAEAIAEYFRREF